jgi:uncharacterized protein DUF4279
MKRASRLATSTTKTDAKAGRKAFVTLRFAGDDLDPAEISAILPVAPSRAHKKGEEFVAGPHAGKLRGRTGIWFLATDKLVDSNELADHLKFIETLLYPIPGDQRRVLGLRKSLDTSHSHARVTCFWRGDRDAEAPGIPPRFLSLLAPLAADVETDFDPKLKGGGKIANRNEAPSVLLMDRIAKWIEAISTTEFKEYNRKKLAYMAAGDFEREHGIVDKYSAFSFGEPIDTQHELVISYLHLNQAVNVLSQSQFYFRRYPFGRLGVSREDHARNICEFYFAQFYIIESRLKICLNKLKSITSPAPLNVGKIIKLFNKEFDQELKMRNGVTHHVPFDDIDLDRLFITRILAESPHLKGKGWEQEHLSHYREFASRWSKRAQRRSEDVQVYLEAVASLMLGHAPFLKH